MERKELIGEIRRKKKKLGILMREFMSTSKIEVGHHCMQKIKALSLEIAELKTKLKET